MTEFEIKYVYDEANKMDEANIEICLHSLDCRMHQDLELASMSIERLRFAEIHGHKVDKVRGEERRMLVLRMGILPSKALMCTKEIE